MRDQRPAVGTIQSGATPPVIPGVGALEPVVEADPPVVKAAKRKSEVTAGGSITACTMAAGRLTCRRGAAGMEPARTVALIDADVTRPLPGAGTASGPSITEAAAFATDACARITLL